MPTLIHALVASAMLVLALRAESGDVEQKDYACSTPPQSFAKDLFEALESTQGEDGLLAVYNEHFSRSFQQNFPFPVFGAELKEVHERLGIGNARGRGLDARMLTRPYIAASRDQASSPARKRVPAQGIDKSGPFDVVFIASSRSGKIEQRVTVGCEDQLWKAFGVWYNPAY